MKQLSSFMILNINGGDLISYTYDIIDDKTGKSVNSNNKESFYVTDDNLKNQIEMIRKYIRDHKFNN